MSHLYVALYLIALVSGVALVPFLYARYKPAKAFYETLTIYCLLGLLVFLGICILYVSVNISHSSLWYRIFVTATYGALGALSYLLPQQHYVLFNLSVNKHLRLLWYVLALIAPTVALAMWFVSPELMRWLTWLPIGVLVMMMLYCQRIFLRLYDQVYSSAIPKRISILLPLVGIGLGIFEGSVLGETITQRGATLSLPLVFLTYSLCLWIWHKAFFPSDIASAELPQLFSQLTQKEREVVQAVSQGLSNKEIATQLGLAPSTVKNHLYAAFKKLGVTNRFALIQALQTLKTPA